MDSLFDLGPCAGAGPTQAVPSAPRKRVRGRLNGLPSSRRRRMLSVFAIGIAGIACTALAWRVCGFCGADTPSSLRHCRQCGQVPGDVGTGDPAGAEKTEQSQPPPEALDVDPRDALILEALREDVSRGHEQVAAGRPNVALGFYRNALALTPLLPPAEATPERTKLLLHWERDCLQALQRVNRTCAACEGSGRARLRIQPLAGLADEPASLEGGPGSCRPCRGTGVTAARNTLEERLAAIRSGAGESDRMQQLAGRRPVGGAWLPEPALPLPGIRDEAALRRAAAAPCTGCGGLRLVDCRRCEGTGTMPCRHQGCRDGWVGEAFLGGGGRTLESQRAQIRRRCPACEGSTVVRCEVCEGAGGIPCRQCGGSGQRAPCGTCGGEGLSVCRRCRGSGTAGNAACEACRGEGVTLCSTCRGEGRRR